MAPKKPQTRLQAKAAKSNRIVTGPKGSKPQSTTNAAIQKQGNKITRGGLGTGRPSGTMSQARSKPIGTGGGGVTKPSGTVKMVNAQKPGMQKLVRKAAQARKANAGRPLVKPVEAQRLMSQRAPGIRQGAAQLRQQAAGTTSPGAQARAAAQGKALRKAAETKRTAKAVSKRMEGVLKAANTARQVAGAASTFTRGGVAAAVLAPRPAGDGTLSAAMKRGDYKPMQGPKPKTTQASFNKKSFDQAFKAARTSGAKQFTWRGKKYTTEMK